MKPRATNQCPPGFHDVLLVGQGGLATQAARHLRSITPSVTQVDRPDQVTDVASDSVERSALEGMTVVIATDPYPPSFGARLRRKHRARKFASNYATLVRTARDFGADRLIACSTAFLYADDGAVPLDPSLSPIDPAAETVAANAAEGAAELFSTLGGQSVVLRFGWVFGDADPISAQVVAAARKGWRLIEGRPGSWVETIAGPDAATAIVAATKAPPGIYNVSDGRPVTQAAINAVLEEATGTRLDPLDNVYWGELGVLFGSSHLLSDTNFGGLTGWRPSGADIRSYLLHAVLQPS